jgi:hypothetical protein
MHCTSESELLDWRFTAKQFVLASSPLRLTTSNFVFQMNTCGYSPYVTSSLTTGWVCRLQFLLTLASAVILRPVPHFTVSHSRLLNLEGQVPVFISPTDWVPLLGTLITYYLLYLYKSCADENRVWNVTQHEDTILYSYYYISVSKIFLRARHHQIVT